MNVIGHQTVQKQLARMIEAETLSHAYILVGPEHVGKRTVAEWVAAKLLRINQTELFRHPDVKIIERAYDEKNERFKRDLTVNEIRDAIQFATESSFQGGYKVIIITDADRMNTEAGNALLKILEEPPAKTIFFLLYQTVAIMPTIKSRAQLLTLGPVDTEELIQGLRENGHETSTVTEIASYANGRPGLVITWLLEPEKLSEHKKIQTEFINILGLPLSEKFLRAETWLSDAKENGGTDELINRLVLWQSALLPHSFFVSEAGQKIPPLVLVAIQDQIQSAIISLRQNSHPRLTVEALLATLP